VSEAPSPRRPRTRIGPARSLSKIPAARPLLLREFLDSEDPERTELLAQILQPHGPTLNRTVLKKILARALSLLEQGNKREEPYFLVLRHADPGFVYQSLTREAQRAKKAKNFGRMEAYLRALEWNPQFDLEARWQLAIATLKNSAKDTGKDTRQKDTALALFRALLSDRSFDAFARIKKETEALTPADFYFLGHHFAEGSGQERLFARDVLKFVAKKWPSDKSAKAARNTLKAESLD